MQERKIKERCNKKYIYFSIDGPSRKIKKYTFLF